MKKSLIKKWIVVLSITSLASVECSQGNSPNSKLSFFFLLATMMNKNTAASNTSSGQLSIDTSNPGSPGTLTHVADFRNLLTSKGETYSVSYFGTKDDKGVPTAITQAVVYQKNSTNLTRVFFDSNQLPVHIVDQLGNNISINWKTGIASISNKQGTALGQFNIIQTSKGKSASLISASINPDDPNCDDFCQAAWESVVATAGATASPTAVAAGISTIIGGTAAATGLILAASSMAVIAIGVPVLIGIAQIDNPKDSIKNLITGSMRRAIERVRNSLPSFRNPPAETTNDEGLTEAGITPSNPTSTCTSCANPPLTLRGTVSGLTGSGLVLTNNGTDDKTITTNGSFTFTTTVASGSNYSVTVKTQPSGQSCSVSNGTGTATVNVTNVNVVCSAIAIPGIVLKTGQVTSYATGDDGTHQKGIARSYTDNSDGTIKDNATGLTWQKCSRGLSVLTCATGSATATDWVTANSYCNSLNLASKTWRLPTTQKIGRAHV